MFRSPFYRHKGTPSIPQKTLGSVRIQECPRALLRSTLSPTRDFLSTIWIQPMTTCQKSPSRRTQAFQRSTSTNSSLERAQKIGASRSSQSQLLTTNFTWAKWIFQTPTTKITWTTHHTQTNRRMTSTFRLKTTRKTKDPTRDFQLLTTRVDCCRWWITHMTNF